MIIPFQDIYGQTIIRPTSNLVVFRSIAGVLKTLDISLSGITDADVIFNFRLNGVTQFTGAGRPKIVAGQSHVGLTGLSISLADDDLLAFDCEVMTGAVPVPVYFRITVEDGIAGSSGALDDLTDVTITSAADGDFLQRVGGVWVNRTIAQILTSLGLADAQTFKGVTDCSANPNYPAANAGDTYKVSVAGKIGGASGVVVEAGDIFLCITDGTASGNQGTVGANWVVIQTNLDGAVTGPASATNNNIVIFNGTTGKVIQDSGKALPSGTVVGTSDTQTLTNKRITARVGTTASSATPTPDADGNDLYTVTALAVNTTITAPSGTPTNGQPMILRVKDAGTAKTIAFDSIYRAVGVTLPTTTVISKTLYLGCIYNSADSKWDVLGVNQEA